MPEPHDAETSEPDEPEKPEGPEDKARTGEEQAAINRENDPPA